MGDSIIEAYNSKPYPLDIGTGAMLEPGKRANVDAEDAYVAGLIDAGSLVPIPGTSTAAPADDPAPEVDDDSTGGDADGETPSADTTEPEPPATTTPPRGKRGRANTSTED